MINTMAWLTRPDEFLEGCDFVHHLAPTATPTELGIASDLIQKAFMNFVVAVMAATTAVKGGVKLHTSIIRTLHYFAVVCQTPV